MRTIARFLLVLSLVVWIGGVIFFSFVVAPAVFSILSAQAVAGRIVSSALGSLHLVGLACGVIFLAATFLTELARAKILRVFVVLMILCTAYSQFRITPQMQQIREAVGGPIQALPPQDAGRAAFDRLHEMSVALEGVVLLCGIGLIGTLAAEEQR
jgi:uncharacterized membrane protein